MTILVKINKITGIPVNILWGFISAIMLGIGSFIWMHISFPADKKQIDIVNANIRVLIQKDSAKAIHEFVSEQKINSIVNCQSDMKDAIKEIKSGQERAEQSQERLQELIITVLKNKSIGIAKK